CSRSIQNLTVVNPLSLAALDDAMEPWAFQPWTVIDVNFISAHHVYFSDGIVVGRVMLWLRLICTYGRLNVCSRDTVQRPTIGANISNHHARARSEHGCNAEQRGTNAEVHRSNENKLSDRHRERTRLRLKMF